VVDVVEPVKVVEPFSFEPDPSLVLGPESLTWKRAGDARVLLCIRPTILLQMAHPNVGAAIWSVMDLSAGDPWWRLVNSADFLTQLIYGGPEAVTGMARGLRKLHSRIKGTTDDGRPYDALDPEAVAWVHATWTYMVAESLRLFGEPLTPSELDVFYAEWIDLGHVLGVRPGDLPDSWSGFERYVDEMVAERLEDNETVRAFMGLFRRRPPERPAEIPPMVWHLATPTMLQISRLAMIAMQPEALRRRLGIELSLAEQAQLLTFRVLSQRLTPVLPEPVLSFGLRYSKVRGTPGKSAAEASVDGGAPRVPGPH
jgi:uncharacterized protein (DUF2236 family)